MNTIQRCPWAGEDPVYVQYHDTEWGVPCYDDSHLFEMLLLEGTQAGLSWITVLKKRPAYRDLFDQFDAKKIAHYSDAKINQLLQNPAIIRNRLKVEAARTNARAYLSLMDTENSLQEFLWKFVGGEPILNHWTQHSQIPTSTDASKQMSTALKKKGFKFVGETICYAYMQAVGMVNDHLITCFRHPNVVQAHKVAQAIESTMTKKNNIE